MVWVLLFIAGLVVLLAGIISLILRGPGPVNTILAALGLIAVVGGAGGVILKPRLPGFDIAALPTPAPVRSVATEQAAEPPRAASVEPEPAAPPPAAAPEPEAAAAPKDESQLAPGTLPNPVSVTTTTVVGNEVDPLADPGAAAAPPAVVPPPAEPPAPAALAPPPPPSDAERLAALAPQQTRDEAAFTKAVSDARTAYDKAGDDDRASLQSTRAAAICAAVKKPEVQGWVGAVKEVDRDPGGRTIISVALPDGTLVKTWNNAMSDVEDKTLILAGTPLAASVGKLAPGDGVRFSGSFFSDEPDCFRSSRLSLDQSMTEPSFLFRFTSFEKL